MGLLAGDRKKQRWSADPRGRKWAEDQNKISNKLMEKMGWKQGEGLGARGDGMLNPIGVKYKMDNLGFGCTQKYDKQWIAHQDSFNDLLAGLSSEAKGETEKKTVMADKAKITSLESSGAKMGHRYKKFTKAKDLTKASAKDMEGIFGRSSVSEAKAATEAAEKEATEEKSKFEQSDKHVTQAENVHEYFKRKMAERMARLSGNVKTEPVTEEPPVEAIKAEPADVKTEPVEETETPKKKKKRKQEVKEEPEEEEVPTKKKKKKKSKVAEVETEQTEEVEEPVEEKPKKKKKSKTVDSESVQEVTEEPEEVEKQTKKKKKKSKKTEVEVEVPEEQESVEAPPKVKKSKKKKKKQSDSE